MYGRPASPVRVSVLLGPFAAFAAYEVAASLSDGREDLHLRGHLRAGEVVQEGGRRLAGDRKRREVGVVAGAPLGAGPARWRRPAPPPRREVGASEQRVARLGHVHLRQVLLLVARPAGHRGRGESEEQGWNEEALHGGESSHRRAFLGTASL